MDLNLVSSEHSKQVALNTQFDKVDKNTNQKVGIAKIEKPIEVLFEGLDLNKYYKDPKRSNMYIKHWLYFLFLKSEL